GEIPGKWSAGVLGVAVADDLGLGPDPLLDLAVAGVALDRGDGAVVVVPDHEADVLDGLDALAAVPGEEDDGAGLGERAPAVVGPEPLGVRHGVGVPADLGAGAGLLADPGDEHGAPGGVEVVGGLAAVAGDGLQGAPGAGVPLLELGAAAPLVLGDADLLPGQCEHLLGGDVDLVLVVPVGLVGLAGGLLRSLRGVALGRALRGDPHLLAPGVGVGREGG